MSKLDLIKQEIKKMAQIPGLDGKTVTAPAVKAPAAPKSAIPTPGGEVPSKPQSVAPTASATSDVRAMQGLLLEFVKGGVIPPTGLPDAKFANGVWGPKTNAALKNVISVAQDTLSMINELRNEGVKIDSDVYTPRYLEALKTYVPNLKGGRADLTPEEQSQWAQTIENHLKAIKVLNQQFNTSVGNSGHLREVKNKTLDQYSSGRQLTELNAEEASKVDNYIKSNAQINVNVPNLKDGGAPLKSIPVKALFSKDNYLDWFSKTFDRPVTNGRMSEADIQQASQFFSRFLLPQINQMQQKVS